MFGSLAVFLPALNGVRPSRGDHAATVPWPARRLDGEKKRDFAGFDVIEPVDQKDQTLRQRILPQSFGDRVQGPF